MSNIPLTACWIGCCLLMMLAFAAGSSGEQKAASAPALDMAYIPGGTFTMGSEDKDAGPDEKPEHTVYLGGFYMDRHEVTNRQYREFILATGHSPPFLDTDWAKPYNWTGTSYPAGTDNHPVVLVSWQDACDYAAWAGKRLPTEAEWEKAARGGLVKQPYPLGKTLEFDHASFDKGYLRTKKIFPVESFKPNPLGLYDMAGNVWEWCQDWYGEKYYKVSPEKNPLGPAEGAYRVLRGGSWINDEKALRCAQRSKNVPEYKSYIIGFRCAKSGAAEQH